MKLMYDPQHGAVGDGMIEYFYETHKDSSEYVWISQHEIILRAQLGLMRGEIDSLTLRVFDHETQTVRIFEADEYANFPGDWYDYIVNEGFAWTGEMVLLQIEKKKAENEQQEED